MAAKPKKRNPETPEQRQARDRREEQILLQRIQAAEPDLLTHEESGELLRQLMCGGAGG